jgi:hypothetical protein
MTTQNTINCHPDDIIWTPTATLYIYNADLYCKPCGEGIQSELEALNCDCPGGKSDCNGSCNWGELQGYHDDSNSWPIDYCRGERESDTPDHCGKCSRFLGSTLTDDGIEYVKESAREDLDQHGAIGEIVQGWLDFYGIELEN